MKKILITVLFAMTQYAHADWDNWKSEEKSMFVASNVAMAADWLTTRDMTKRYNEGYSEINPFLGKNPGTDRLDAYFVLMFISNYFITDYLTNYRMLYLQMRTAAHGTAAINNYSIGLRFNF